MKKKAEKQPYLYLRLIEMLLGILITAIGLSCMMKSQLGQTAITAFTQNLTAITGIKSGTVLIIFFISCAGAQIVILKKQFANIQYLQIPLALLQGKIVNLICYDVPGLCDWYPKTYIGKWLCIFSGILFCSYGVAVLFHADLVKNPFEELAMVISKRLRMEFCIFRTRIDIVFMLLSLFMILCFHLDFTTVREGTWVCMLLLGKSMKYTFPFAAKTSVYHRKVNRKYQYQENVT